MKYQPPALAAETFVAVCEHAVKYVLTPEDVIRLSGGRRSVEPILLDTSNLPTSFRYGVRYLGILSVLFHADSDGFENAVSKIRGTIRTYFAKSGEEIESTGQSNHSGPIPNSPWFASVNNSEVKRRENIALVMRYMEFSSDYAFMISSLASRHKPLLPSSYAARLKKL